MRKEARSLTVLIFGLGRLFAEGKSEASWVADPGRGVSWIAAKELKVKDNK